MAKKKTAESRAVGTDVQAFTVVLEDLRGQFSVFGESLQGLRQEMGRRFDVVDQRFEQVDRRFEAVDQRFEQVDRRFEAVDQRFASVDQRFDAMEVRFELRFRRVDGDLGFLKAAVLDNSRELKAVGQAVAAMAGVLDEKVGRADVEEIVERALEKRGR